MLDIFKRPPKGPPAPPALATPPAPSSRDDTALVLQEILRRLVRVETRLVSYIESRNNRDHQ